MEKPVVKKNADNERKENIILEILKVIFSTPFAVIISGVIGFWISHFFQAPKPEVEDVRIDPYYYYSKLDENTMNILNENPETVALIKEDMLKNSDFKDQFLCTGWLDDGMIYDNTCYDKIIQIIQADLTNIKADSASCKKNLFIVNNWSFNSPLPALISFPNFDSEVIFSFLSRNQKEDALVHIRNIQDNLKQDFHLFSTLNKALNKMKNYHFSNGNLMGQVDFYLDLINKGESDALVDKYGSYLVFKKEKLNLKHEDHEVLKPHSYTKAKFFIDVAKNDPVIMENWEKLVRDTSISLPYEIHISIDGDYYEKKDTIKAPKIFQ